MSRDAEDALSAIAAIGLLFVLALLWIGTPA